MKKKMFFMLSFIAMVLIVSHIAMAQGNAMSGQKGCCKANCYVDKNSDGICDHCTGPASCRNGKGKCCGSFVDANNDGRCDNCPCPDAPCPNRGAKCNRKGPCKGR